MKFLTTGRERGSEVTARMDRISGLQSKSVSPELVIKILDSFEGLVYVADMESGEILFANSYFQRTVGFDPTGRHYLEVAGRFHAGDQRFCDNRRLIGDDGTPSGVLIREFQNPFNKKWYSAKAQAIEWSPNHFVRLEVALDVTEHMQLKGFLQEARQQAESAMATKNRFIALVAHDLKSPFVSILGMLRRILRKETFEHEVHRQFLESIIVNGQRMLKMIDNLLDMDRLETGQVRPEPTYFNLGDMVVEVFDNFTHLASIKRLQLTSSVPDSVEIYADKYLYFVVLNNLISNAVKFSFVAGKIDVSFEKDERAVRLVVKDEGKGIPQSYIENLFRPDVKTTSKGTRGETGSGLGLVFCQQIMKAHGGSISLSTTEGKGTTFYVELSPSCRLPGGDERDLEDGSD